MGSALQAFHSKIFFQCATNPVTEGNYGGKKEDIDLRSFTPIYGVPIEMPLLAPGFGISYDQGSSNLLYVSSKVREQAGP